MAEQVISTPQELVSRRAVLAGASIAAFPTASAASKFMSTDNLDTELLALDTEFGNLYPKWIVLRLAHDERCDDLLDQLASITERMRALKPTTLAGFAAKASLVLDECLDMEQKEQLWSCPQQHLDFDVLVAWGFLNELRAAIGLGPTPMRNV